MEGGERSAQTPTATEALPQSSPIPSELPVPANRFVFVDGLRGLAALAIVVFHVWNYEPDPWPAFESSHWLVNAAFKQVRAAVQVLLVVSGFVVAYTLRKTWVTPREVAWFLGRRIVRLIPPYWVTIGIVIIVDLLCVHALDVEKPFKGPLSVPRVSKHLTLTQEIFRHEEEALSAGVWTICIEMQFYIVAIVGAALAQRLVPGSGIHRPRTSGWALLAVFAPPAFICLFYWRSMKSTDPWVIHYIWMFFLGMITWWTLERTVSTFVYSVIIGAGVAALVWRPDWVDPGEASFLLVPNAVALSTAVAIFTAGRFDRLQSWLNWSWLQYLGRISYSLYLIHFPVCHLVTTAAWKWCNNSPTPVQAYLILLSALGCSTLAAHVLYTFVEAPSNRMAAEMKRAAESSTSRKPNALQTV